MRSSATLTRPLHQPQEVIRTDVRIGTSGWHYDHWRGPYYPHELPASRMLEIYLRDFDSVEINNSFYRLPTENAYESWRKAVPPNFVFAVKGSRYLTHMKKLKDPEEGISRFFERAEVLGKKLGPILFQLPPRWKANPERLDVFIRALPTRHRSAFELRDRRWLVEDVYRVLRKHNAAYCIYEIAGFRSPTVITADFTYVRLHGPEEHAYRGSYHRETLKGWAKQILQWRGTMKAVYVYFDNDQAAYAVHNALELKRLVK